MFREKRIAKRDSFVQDRRKPYIPIKYKTCFQPVLCEDVL